MYRKNPRSTQPLLLSDINSLPSKLVKRLQRSWATTFREEVFQRIDEVRVTMTILFSALAVNVRRIDRYMKDRQRGKLTTRGRRQAACPAPAG